MDFFRKCKTVFDSHEIPRLILNTIYVYIYEKSIFFFVFSQHGKFVVGHIYTVKDNRVKKVLTSQLSHGKSDYLHRIKSPRSHPRCAFTVKWDHTLCLPVIPVYVYSYLSRSISGCTSAMCIFIPKRKVTFAIVIRWKRWLLYLSLSLSLTYLMFFVSSSFISGGVQLVTGPR